MVDEQALELNHLMITFLDCHYVDSRWSGRVKLNSHGYESQGLAKDKLSLSLSTAGHLDCVESGHIMIWTTSPSGNAAPAMNL
jgi:hypothetical protein